MSNGKCTAAGCTKWSFTAGLCREHSKLAPPPAPPKVVIVLPKKDPPPPLEVDEGPRVLTIQPTVYPDGKHRSWGHYDDSPVSTPVAAKKEPQRQPLPVNMPFRIVLGTSPLPENVLSMFQQLPAKFEDAPWVGYAAHIFDIPSRNLCISGYSPGLIEPGASKNQGGKPDGNNLEVAFALPPSVKELREIALGLSDEEQFKSQTLLQEALLEHMAKDVAITIMRYTWEPEPFVGAPIIFCGLRHMFLRGEKELLCQGVSTKEPRSFVLAYKTRTKLLVFASHATPAELTKWVNKLELAILASE